MNWYKAAEETSKGVVAQYIEGFREMLKNNGTPKGFSYSNLYDFLHQHGRQYTSQPLNEQETALLKNTLKRACDYKMKQCFWNAQAITQRSLGKIRYIEGVAICGLIPMDHAWNTINGKVIDFTWKHNNDNQPILGVFPEGWEYYGVEFTRKEIAEYWNKHGESAAFLQNYQDDFPAFRKPYVWPDERGEEKT